MIQPHFTFVFPVAASLEDVVAEALSAVDTPTIQFLLTGVRAVSDAFSRGGGHVFLTPDQGAPEIEALHSRLYAGALKWAHRDDVPYIPHITIGGYSTFDRCQVAAQQMKQEAIAIPGVVERLTVVEISGPVVHPVATFDLDE